MNERIKAIAEQAGFYVADGKIYIPTTSEDITKCQEKFAELLMQDMHRKVIASILITDVVITEKGQNTTSEDYIRAINHDFGIE